MNQVQAIDCITCGWRGGATVSMREAEKHAEQHGHQVLHHFSTEFDGRSDETKLADERRRMALES